MEPEPLEELDDKEQVGADPVERAERPGDSAPGISESTQQPTTNGATQSGASSDHKANQRQTAKQQSSKGSSSLATRAKGGGATRGVVKSAKSKLKKRIAAGIAVALVSAIIALFSFLGYLSIELVHVGEDITHFFEKRISHTIQQREGLHYKKVFDQADGNDPDTGAPIDDAYHEYSMDQFKTDMDIKSIDFNSSGEVVAFTKTNGDRLSISDATLDDPSSDLMEALSSRFPEVPFFEDSARSRNLDASWGIERKLLSNADEDVPSDEAALTDQTEQEFAAREADSDGVTTGESTDIENANQELSDAVSEHGADAEGTGVEADAAALSPIPGAKYAVVGCATKAVAKGIQDSLVIIRASQLMRVAVAILSTGAQIKRGDVHISQVGVVVKWLAGFARSASWQRVTGSDPTAQISKSQETKYSPYGGNTIASSVSSLGGSGTGIACDVINSKGGLAVIIGVDVASIFGGEGTALEKIWAATRAIASNAAQSEIFSQVAKQLVQVATNALKKPALTLAAGGGIDLINATISGSDSYFNASAMSNGGERLNGAQVTQLNQEADAQENQYAQQKGLAYQLLSPDYTHSLVSTLLDKGPTSPDDLTTGVDSMVAAISSPFSGKGLTSIGSFLVDSSPAASAYSAADDQEDPSGWGVPQFGFPDSLLEQYPDPEANEQWVLTDLCKHGQTLYDSETFNASCVSNGGDGSGELTDQNNSHDDDYHNFVNKCLLSINPNDYLGSDCQDGGPPGFDGTPSYDHFRVYRLDLGIANMIVSYNNNQNDQNDPDGDSSGTSVSPGGNLPSGNAQSLAQDLLANKNVVYESDAESDIQDAANGQPGTCHVPVSTALLQLLDYLAKSGHSFHISAVESSCQGHSGPGDPHYEGRAADITQVDGDPLITGTGIGAGGGRTAHDVAVMQELAPLMPPSPSTTDWTQWSGFGQQGCGPEPDPTLPNGIHQFGDLCNHLHIQVAP